MSFTRRSDPLAWLVLAFCLLGPCLARGAQPAPLTCVEVEGEGALARQLESIQFELGQGGHAVLPHRDQIDRCVLTVRLIQGATSWRLELFEHRVDLDGPVSWRSGEGHVTPELAGLIAVELLHAWRSRPEAEAAASPVDTGPQPGAASVEPVEPAVVRLHDHDHDHGAVAAATVVTTSRTDVSRAPSLEGWRLDVAGTFASLGSVGASLGARYQWRRADLGLFAEAANFAIDDESIASDGSTARARGGGVFRLRLTPSWVFLPDRRVRPHIGVGNELLIAVARTRRTSADIDVDGRTAGVWWVPSLELGVRVPVHRAISLRLAMRGGPTVSLRPLSLDPDRQFSAAGLFVGGGLGLAFDLR